MFDGEVGEISSKMEVFHKQCRIVFSLLFQFRNIPFYEIKQNKQAEVCLLFIEALPAYRILQCPMWIVRV